MEAADAAASRWLAAKLGNDEAAELVRQNPQLAEGSPARFARAWTALEDQLGKRRAREVLTKQPRVLSASGASIRVVLPVLVEVLGKDGAKVRTRPNKTPTSRGSLSSASLCGAATLGGLGFCSARGYA